MFILAQMYSYIHKKNHGATFIRNERLHIDEL